MSDTRFDAIGDIFLSNFKSGLIAAAEIGGNQLISLDDALLPQCRELQGRCIAIHFTDLELTLFCHPGNWGIRLSDQTPSREVDATIAGRVFALINLASNDDKISTSIRERVNINGDAQVAKTMQNILASINIDWEEQLSRVTGDVLAVQISKQLRGFHQWAKQGFQSLSQSGSEYLREEVKMTPTQTEFELFSDELKTVREAVERNEARIRHLTDTIDSKLK
ncbi:MAG: ubiquinone biosynthesis protein UbiJ [Gammaproteobacteria bacterium]|jgi:ubiquinone biosynthesis protein UbiJ